MRQIFVLILSLVICWSGRATAPSREFCDAFNDNKQTISYVFRRDFSEITRDKVTTHDIVINGQYWRLHFHVNYSLTFVDPKRQGKMSPFFGGQYLMAVCVRRDSPVCHAVLFPRSDWRQAVIGSIANDDYLHEKELSEFKQTGSQPFSVQPFRPTLAFALPFDRFSRLVFVEKFTNGSLTPFVFRVYTDLFISEDKSLQKDFDSIKELRTKYEVIGILPQKDPNSPILGLIYFLQDNSKISYMWCSANTIEYCKPQKVLVDCFTPQKSSQLLLVVIVAIILIVVIIIAIVVFYVWSKSKDKKIGDSAAKKSKSPRLRTSTSSTIQPVAGVKKPSTASDSTFKPQRGES